MTAASDHDLDELRRAAAEMIADLRTSRAVPGIEVGAQAPSFVLPDATGSSVALADRLADGPVVVSFYRGAWCPYCNLELRELQQSLEAITGHGASLMAISPQAPDQSLSLAEKLELEFDVLSDVDQSVIRAYRLGFEMPPAMQRIYTKLDSDLTRETADGSWSLPVPGTFVIDAAGVVRARHVDPNYVERMPVGDILAALDALR